MQKHDIWRAVVESALERALPPEGTPPALLHGAMRQAVLGGGKRLRGMLCLLSCEVCGGDTEQALAAAAALEVLHAYTLVHDDLPAMDDDDLRRGQPAIHIRYGEGNAILCGDALLTLAFELLAEPEVLPSPPCPARLVAVLARAAGSRGVVAGQFDDLRVEGQSIDAATLHMIHLHKTADLMEAACRMGALCGGGDEKAQQDLGVFGRSLGLAFQVIDDLLDETAEPDVLGKPVGSDREAGKATSVSCLGLDGARELAAHHTQQSRLALLPFGTRASALEQLAGELLSRAY